MEDRFIKGDHVVVEGVIFDLTVPSEILVAKQFMVEFNVSSLTVLDGKGRHTDKLLWSDKCVSMNGEWL